MKFLNDNLFKLSDVIHKVVMQNFIIKINPMI